MPISGVILAAGESARLGRPKQLLELDGEPIVRIVVRTATQSRLDEVVLVVGANAAEVARASGDFGQVTVENQQYNSGQSTSLHAGLLAVSPSAEAVIFMLGDQPEVGVDVIDALIETFERSGTAIVQPVYGSTPANPVLFARSKFPDLMAIAGDQGARTLIRRLAQGVVRVPVGHGPPPGDVDTDEDYVALVARWAAKTIGTTGPTIE
jgi:molybdenum cofactor cytidylyltransferase